MSEVRRVLLANGQYIEIVQETGSSTGSVMSQSAVTAALNGKANTTHTHAASDITSGTFGSARIADGAITKAKLASDVISSLPASSYETVIVTATVSNNQPVNGLAVLINSLQYTFNSTGKIYAMVPQGQVYSVTPVSTEIFNASGGGTYTASTGNRSVVVSYSVAYGIYIEDKYGVLYTVGNWSSGNNANANSVVVVTVVESFRISKSGESLAMHSSYDDNWDDTLTPITKYDVAKADYNGVYNTQQIMKLQPSSGYAAGWCDAYIFPDGVTKGYLPAMGEIDIIMQNLSNINTALSKCGGESIQKDYHLSSTYYGLYGSYHMFWSVDLYNQYYFGVQNLGTKGKVRPLGVF